MKNRNNSGKAPIGAKQKLNRGILDALAIAGLAQALAVGTRLVDTRTD